MHRPIAVVIALTVAASTAGAQVLPVPRRSTMPAAWVSLSAGFLDLQGFTDGSTGTGWDFSSTVQYRGSLEIDLKNGGSLGLSAAMADAPLRYVSQGSPEPLPPTCTSVCDAHAKVWTLQGAFHLGGGVGFHQVIDVGVGAIIYRDFEADDGGALPPASPDADAAFTFGYGFGYGFSSRVQLMIVQEFSYALHQREGLSGGEGSSYEQRVTRIGLRYGVGAR